MTPFSLLYFALLQLVVKCSSSPSVKYYKDLVKNSCETTLANGECVSCMLVDETENLGPGFDYMKANKDQDGTVKPTSVDIMEWRISFCGMNDTFCDIVPVIKITPSQKAINLLEGYRLMIKLGNHTNSYRIDLRNNSFAANVTLNPIYVEYYFQQFWESNTTYEIAITPLPVPQKSIELFHNSFIVPSYTYQYFNVSTQFWPERKNNCTLQPFCRMSEFNDCDPFKNDGKGIIMRSLIIAMSVCFLFLGGFIAILILFRLKCDDGEDHGAIVEDCDDVYEEERALNSAGIEMEPIVSSKFNKPSVSDKVIQSEAI